MLFLVTSSSYRYCVHVVCFIIIIELSFFFLLLGESVAVDSFILLIVRMPLEQRSN